MDRSLTARLSIMMFLQFFIWGAWYVTVGNYMAANGMASLTHWPYTVNPIAAIIAPFFLGLVADRYFSTEKVLAVLHLLGGAIMLFVPQLVANPTMFILMLLAYNLCYMPTLGLANSLAFHNIDDQEKQFPLIRVFGTIGWIVAGFFIAIVLGMFAGEQLPDTTPLPLYTTGVASLLLGVYCFSLPHTPPPAAGEHVSVRSILGLDAFKQLGSRPFYVFIVSSLLLCIPLAAYYNFAPIVIKNAIYDVGVDQYGSGSSTYWILSTVFPNPSSLMTLGQISEVVFMLLMPLFFRKLGVKWMLTVGMGAWVVRYILFAAGAPGSVFWMLAGGILMHGICYDFFFVTGQIYVDKKSTAAVRGQAQGFLVFVTYGVGMLIGAQVAGNIFNRFLGGADALNLAQWQDFWFVPAGFAALVMVLFAFLFNDKVDDGAETPAA
ncbi:MAG: MFS transporter [Rhodothermales bacterium]|nr:MFS transporter [Rhodothermales bacterium]